MNKVIAKIKRVQFFWNTVYIPGGPKKTSRNLRKYNGAYTLWGDISFGTFVDQYLLLLTYKFQWRH